MQPINSYNIADLITRLLCGQYSENTANLKQA